MGKYWLKIGLRAGVIFLVGFAILSAGRGIHGKIESNADLTIPLGGFIPFKLDGVEVGKLRSLTIHRSAPKVITGFRVSARVTDSLLFEKFRECRVSVTDARHFDERTTFLCLQSDSGYRAFGEVRISRPVDGGITTIIQPLMLTERDIRQIQGNAGEPAASPLADSLESTLRGAVRERQRSFADSVEAVRLENRAKDMQRRADSLRAKSPAPPSQPAPRP